MEVAVSYIFFTPQYFRRVDEDIEQPLTKNFISLMIGKLDNGLINFISLSS